MTSRRSCHCRIQCDKWISLTAAIRAKESDESPDSKLSFLVVSRLLVDSVVWIRHVNSGDVQLLASRATKCRLRDELGDSPRRASSWRMLNTWHSTRLRLIGIKIMDIKKKERLRSPGLSPVIVMRRHWCLCSVARRGCMEPPRGCTFGPWHERSYINDLDVLCKRRLLSSFIQVFA